MNILKTIGQLFPTGLYFKLCRKTYPRYRGVLLREDDVTDDYGNTMYREMVKGEVMTLTHYMLPELILVDDGFSKEKRIEQLKKEISKLEKENA